MRLCVIRRNRWLAKLFILVPLVLVVLLNVRLINQVREFNSDDSSLEDDAIQLADLKLNNYEIKPSVGNSSPTKLLSKNSHQLNNQSIRLKKFINNANLNPKIRNKQFIFNLLQRQKEQEANKEIGLVSTVNSKDKKKINVYKAPTFLVILIQVHSRLSYLKELIQSLKETKHIEDTLVVFSHDIIDSDMNDLINTIDFCATLQIFYPFSLQIYSDTFPGRDPNDCTKSMGKKQAILENCNNAFNPDSFGNYREHTIVQIKHHWFWKLGYTFEQLNETRDLNNLHVLLLEEDYFLFPDAIHTLRKLSERILSDIDVVSLAVFEKNKQNLDMKNFNRYSKAIWHSSTHNTGLMLSRAQWKMLKDCLNAFCTYDDYNWDWTLQWISQHCFKLPLVSIYPDLSRVVHVGECGIHHKGKNCDPKEKINLLKDNFKKNFKYFFPSSFNIGRVNTAIKIVKKSNGGWSDPRDHELCKSFASPVSARNNLTLFI